jgi:hypothetical protein
VALLAATATATEHVVRLQSDRFQPSGLIRLDAIGGVTIQAVVFALIRAGGVPTK